MLMLLAPRAQKVAIVMAKPCFTVGQEHMAAMLAKATTTMAVCLALQVVYRHLPRSMSHLIRSPFPGFSCSEPEVSNIVPQSCPQGYYCPTGSNLPYD
jgi:hypothetical protein